MQYVLPSASVTVDPVPVRIWLDVEFDVTWIVSPRSSMVIAKLARLGLGAASNPVSKATDNTNKPLRIPSSDFLDFMQISSALAY
jgi:hypothetical protein